MDALTILRKHTALQRLSESSLADLAEMTTVRKTLRGQTLWQIGDRVNTFAVVGSGLVTLTHGARGPRELVTGLHQAGESLDGLNPLDGGRSLCEAATFTASSLVAFTPCHLVASELERNAGAAMAMAREMSRRTTVAYVRMSGFLASAEERLAATLLDLCERFGDDIERGAKVIPLRITRLELASLVGATVETIIRTFKRWSQEGLVSTTISGIILHDPATLAMRVLPPPMPRALASHG